MYLKKKGSGAGNNVLYKEFFFFFFSDKDEFSRTLYMFFILSGLFQGNGQKEKTVMNECLKYSDFT